MKLTDFSADVQEQIKEHPSWLQLLPNDPRKYLLESKESFTVYRTLLDIFNIPQNHPDVEQAFEAMTSDPQVLHLLNNLSNWEKDVVTGHNKPSYLPNQLSLLLDWGLNPSNNVQIKSAFDIFLDHQDIQTGQFLAHTQLFDRKSKHKYIDWSSVLCDHNLITSILILAGYQQNSKVKLGIKRMHDLISKTEQGMGWKCIPWLGTKFRGPGRANEMCPIATLDALKGYWMIPEKNRPKNLLLTGNALLNCWMNRGQSKPYMFGHGRNFRRLKPPFFWYNVGSVLEATSQYPDLVKTQAFQELSAVLLLAFNSEGLIIPKSVKRDFKEYSFGQKKSPSPWVTFYACRILKRAATADSIFVKKVSILDGSSFKGSKGGPKKSSKRTTKKTTKKN